jgi:hypothetical protein
MIRVNNLNYIIYFMACQKKKFLKIWVSLTWTGPEPILTRLEDHLEQSIWKGKV